MWASGFSLTTVNSSLSKTNEQGHAGWIRLIPQVYHLLSLTLRLTSFFILGCGSQNNIRHDNCENLSQEPSRAPLHPPRQDNINNELTLLDGCKFTCCAGNRRLSAPVAYLKSRIDLFWDREPLVSEKTISRLFCCCSKQRSSSF